MKEQKPNSHNPELFQRFEQMLSDDVQYFFDVEEFQEVIDHYIQNLDNKKAEKIICIARMQHPHSTDILMSEAELHMLDNRFEKALNILENVENIDPSNPDLFLIRASIYSQMGRSKLSIDHLKRALELSYDDIDSLYLSLAFEYENSNNFDEALKYLKLALKENPRNSDALFEIAYCYERMGRLSESIKLYNEFINEQPYSYSAWYNLGYVYNKTGKQEKAVYAYDYACIINPEFSPAYLNKGNTLMHMGKMEEAVDTLLEGVSNCGANADLYSCLGECYEKKEEYENAILNFNRALKLDEDLAEAWVGMGVCLDNLGRTLEGLHNLKKGLELDSMNPDYWFIFADTQAKLGFADEACDAYLKVVELDPHDVEAYLEYSTMLHELEQTDKAIETIITGVEHNPKSADLLYRICALCLYCGLESDAADYLDQALALDYDKFDQLFDFLPVSRHNERVLELIELHKRS